ncbi:hypothetical protein ACWKWP_15770 [Agromyces soli]
MTGIGRGRRSIAIVGGITAAAVVAALVVLGVVGVEQTVTAGSQARVCGVRLGVDVSGDAVRLLGASDASLAVGDRVRVGPLCVVEVVGIDDADATAGEDGASAHVQLRWRLW